MFVWQALTVAADGSLTSRHATKQAALMLPGGLGIPSAQANICCKGEKVNRKASISALLAGNSAHSPRHILRKVRLVRLAIHDGYEQWQCRPIHGVDTQRLAGCFAVQIHRRVQSAKWGHHLPLRQQHVTSEAATFPGSCKSSQPGPQ